MTDRAHQVLAQFLDAGLVRADTVAIVVAHGGHMHGRGVDVHLSEDELGPVVTLLEQQLRPRWLWWSSDTASELVQRGLRVATCWDLAAGHRLLFGGWRADPGLVWSSLHGLAATTIPEMGQLDLLTSFGDDGTDPENPVRPDGHLRPEWVSGGWARSPDRMALWAHTAAAAVQAQARLLAAVKVGGDVTATTRSESGAELMCVELGAEGLPIDHAVAEQIIASFIGPRPRDHTEEFRFRRDRDSAVLSLLPGGERTDLRNPAQVRALLLRIGIDVPDTRSWRLEPYRDAHPLVDALLRWRKSERIATTYGYQWLDQRVGAAGRLRGAWTGSDGAAGRMTAQAGLHNLPTELRAAVVAEPGHRFVRADLGQIEPRVLAAVSGDRALAAATIDHDLYAPVAARLKVERAVAKVAVLAAMYGQTSGTAGEALKGLESAYPVAMAYLKRAYDHGYAGTDVHTYGGRLIRMPPMPRDLDETGERSWLGGRARFARNAVIQGAAAELFKAWAVTVRNRIVSLDAQIVMCLHDELLIHVPDEHGEAVGALLHNCLDEASRRWTAQAPVRFVADVGIISRWSEAKH